MSEFKGTKGKWGFCKRYDENDTPIFSVKSKEGVLAHCYNLQICCGIQERTMANALLISKAPELLDFLKKYYRFLNLDDQKKAEKLIKEATEI